MKGLGENASRHLMGEYSSGVTPQITGHKIKRGRQELVGLEIFPTTKAVINE